MGFGYDSYISVRDAERRSNQAREKLLIDALVLTDKQIEKYGDIHMEYSDGWTAEVNGKSADIEKVSYGFMAVKADAGESKIVFRYRTPGLVAGTILTVIGLLLLAGYIIISRLFFKNDKEYGHTHFYGYNSLTSPDASHRYCESLLRKD